MGHTGKLNRAGLHAILPKGGESFSPSAAKAVNPERDAALNFVREKRSVQWDEDVKRKIQSKLDFLSAKFPECSAAARKLASDGIRIGKLFDEAWKAGVAGDEARMVALGRELEALSPTPLERERLGAKFKNGADKRKSMIASQNQPVIIPGPDYDPKGKNPHFLRNLRPSRRWMVAMDETGMFFTSDAVSQGPDRGRYVAVLVPEESNLRRLAGGDHAKDTSDARTAELLTALYASRPYCGILGVTLDDMAVVSEYAHVNYWYNLIERTIDLILRLVPLAKAGTTQFSFLVEGRAGTHAREDVERMRGMAERALHSCLYRLAKADPEREAAIRAEITVEFKGLTKNGDFLSYNGYADAIASAWAAMDHRRITAKSLGDYGLRGKCLLCGSSQNLADILDNVHMGVPLAPEVWGSALASVRADGPDSIAGIVLSAFGQCVRKDAGLWKTYLDETLRHVDSHAVNLRMLGSQISWLTSCMPPKMNLPSRLELLWLTVRLAHANHSGATEAQMKAVNIDMGRFRELIGSLYEEDAPLACWATLHLTVQATDAFDFALARKYVLDFLNIGLEKQAACGFSPPLHDSLSDMSARNVPEANPAVMGLRYYAELLSSLGQHAAFEGDNATATGYFRQAINGFSRLSDMMVRKNEIGKTRAYLATAAMDDQAVGETDLSGIMRDYLGGDPVSMAAQLAVSAASEPKYRHHILLRYIVSGRAPKNVAKAYLAYHDNWAHCDDGHPWELIEFYRALIIDDPAEKVDLLRRAYENARYGGPTLWVIACVILNALVPLDPSAAADFRRYLDEVKKALPALGSDRLAALEGALAAPAAPLDLARSVLPFNFR